MKPIKYSRRDTNKIDLGTKTILKYPSLSKDLDIGVMIVNGRHPQDKNTYLIEHACSFVIYVTKGNGIVYAGDEEFQVVAGDVVFVPSNNKFAVEGNMEYVTVDSPAFYPEQSEEVQIK